jgi:hypothetical protein
MMTGTGDVFVEAQRSFRLAAHCRGSETDGLPSADERLDHSNAIDERSVGRSQVGEPVALTDGFERGVPSRYGWVGEANRTGGTRTDENARRRVRIEGELRTTVGPFDNTHSPHFEQRAL